MGKSAGRAPAAPDPTVVANAQAKANMDAAAANRVDTFTPFGSVTFNRIGEDAARRHADFSRAEFEAGRYRPANPAGGDWAEGQTPTFDWNREFQAALNSGPNANRWESTQTLSPEAQALVANLFQDAGADGGRARVEDALFSRINPSLERDREGLESRLRNQGLAPGGEAWRSAMEDFGRNVNDARLAVTAQAGNEQSRAIQALLQMAGAAPGGGGGGGGGTSPVDVQSIFANQQASDMAAYNTRAQNAASGNAAGAGIAAAAITAAAAIA
jgi:hypothetical protein